LNAYAEMKIRLGERDAAVMRFSESQHAFRLDVVHVPSAFRSAGLGTALIRRLFAIADALGKPIHTTARPIGQSNPEILARLVRYYERLGFSRVEDGFGSVHMKRPARKRGDPP
jgi:GNAT superfamily N-acetyltransferase